jgi:hypothetical protein
MRPAKLLRDGVIVVELVERIKGVVEGALR